MSRRTRLLRMGGTVLALLVVAPLLWRAAFPPPAFAVLDRDLVETQVALLRLTHAQPGIPERADLKGLDAAAIDRAVALTAAEAGLPLMDRRAVLSTAGAQPLDLTEAVFARLGVTPADRAALAQSLEHGWAADVNLARDRAGEAPGASGRRLLSEADRVEAAPPAPGADEDFAARAKRLLKTIRGESTAAEDFSNSKTKGAAR